MYLKYKMDRKDMFEWLRSKKAILPDSPETYKVQEVSYITKKLFTWMNNSSTPAGMWNFLSRLAGNGTTPNVAVFSPLVYKLREYTKTGM